MVPRVREILSKYFEVKSHTVGNPFRYSRGGHRCDWVRSGTRKSEATPDSLELLYASPLGMFACVRHSMCGSQCRDDTVLLDSLWG